MSHLLLMDETIAFLIYKNYERNRNKGKKWMSRTWMLTIIWKVWIGVKEECEVKLLWSLMEWLRASLFCPELFDDWLSCCLNVLYIMNSVHASRYYHVYILNDDQNFTNRRASVNTNTKTNLGCCIANMSGVLKMVLKNVNCTPELHFTELRGLL